MGIFSTVANVGTLGLAGKGPMSDLMFGKKESGPQLPPEVVAAQRQARAAQLEGLKGLKASFATPAAESVQAQAGLEQRGIANAAEDARRRLQETIVRRGMGNSSIGLGQEVGLQRQAAEQQQAIGASIPQKIQEEQQRRSQALMSAGGNILGNMGEIFMPEKAKRSGGIASIFGTGLGAVIGAKAGNPAMGAQIGGGIGQAFQGAKS